MKTTLLGIAVLATMTVASVASAQPAWPPAGQSFQGGRYELRQVQSWEPGYTQQVWVDGSCRQGRGNRWRQRCSPGHYQTVSVPGRTVTAQQWVWVAWPSPAVHVRLPMPGAAPYPVYRGGPSRYAPPPRQQAGRWNNGHGARPVKGGQHHRR